MFIVKEKTFPWHLVEVKVHHFTFPSGKTFQFSPSVFIIHWTDSGVSTQNIFVCLYDRYSSDEKI